MEVLSLLKTFSYLGDSTSSFATEWMSFPAELENAQLVVVVKSRIGSSVLTIQLQTSWDTDSVSAVGSPVVTGAPGTQVISIAGGLGPMVRLLLSSAASSQVIVSVYLTPKSS